MVKIILRETACQAIRNRTGAYCHILTRSSAAFDLYSAQVVTALLLCLFFAASHLLEYEKEQIVAEPPMVYPGLENSPRITVVWMLGKENEETGSL